MAKKITYTNGIVRQFPDDQQFCWVTGADEAKNKWCKKKIADLLVGDKTAYYFEPKGPVSEIATIVDI